MNGTIPYTKTRRGGEREQRVMKNSHKDRMYTLSSVRGVLGEGTVNGMMFVYVCVRAVLVILQNSSSEGQIKCEREV